MFQQIHEIVFHGKGGYDFGTVYNLPIWYRMYIYKQISEYYRKVSEDVKKSSEGTSLTKVPQPKKPNFTVKRPD